MVDFRRYLTLIDRTKRPKNKYDMNNSMRILDLLDSQI